MALHRGQRVHAHRGLAGQLGEPRAQAGALPLAAQLRGEPLGHLEAQRVDQDEGHARPLLHQGVDDILVDGALAQAPPGQRPVLAAEREEGRLTAFDHSR